MYESVVTRQRKAGTAGLIVLALAAVVIVGVGAYFAASGLSGLGVSSRTVANLDAIVEKAGKRHFVDPLLIKAVIWRESGFRPDARGSKGEIGLMQVIPKYAVRDWETTHRIDIPREGVLFDPRLNVEIGSWYLGRAVDYWRGRGSPRAIELALCEYNAGRSAVKGWPAPTSESGDRGWIKVASTREYVRTVMDKYAEYRRNR